MYQSAHSAVHSLEEHVQIVDALEKRDPRQAARLMAHHVAAMEQNLIYTRLGNPLGQAELADRSPDETFTPRLR